MYSVCRKAAPIVVAVVAAFASFACEREQRNFSHSPTPSGAPNYDANAYALSEGKRLYAWYNCNGCHAEGGGDKGPALMDDAWLYGSEPKNVFQSIAEGRPNGMPPFGGKIAEQQIWQLVAYVRSMSGLASPTASPGRDDALSAKEPEQARARERSPL